ncbi:30S ribosomal protein S16 [Candidatus Omnitrophota bacterium]
MSVRLRLRKVGKSSKGAYNFKIVACDKREGRDSRFLDEIGYYDPSKKPAVIKINRAKADLWLKKGAQPSATVKSLLKKGDTGNESTTSN